MNVLKRLLKESKKYRVYMVSGLLSLLLVTIIQLVSPQIIRKLVSLISDNDPELVKKAIIFSVILLILYLAEWAFSFVKSYLNHVAAWRFVGDMRMKIYNHIQNLSLGYFHDKQTGQLMSRVANDTRHMEELIAHAVPELMVAIVTFVGVLVMIFFINPMLSLFTIMTIPFSFFLVKQFAFKVRPMFKKARQKEAEMNAVLHDNLNGIREIQSFYKQEGEYKRLDAVSNEHIKMNLDALKLSALYHPAVSFVTRLGTVLVFGIGGILASKEQMPVEDIVAFMLYLNMFFQPINALARLNETIQDSIACGERMFEVLDSVSDVKECENPIELGRVKGEICFENLSFSYIKEKQILKNINLTVKSGEMVALVGYTGVGKTTLSNLLMRFYDCNEGRILLDGTDIKFASLKSLRDNISVVLQDVYLFNGTVAENIAYGTENASIEDIKNAARSANADEFIMALPDGYDTIVGERGLKLSGGQKQRISIARALLRDAPVLILDEATSSVDMETEHLIHEAIENAVKGRTTLVIAHRLASIKKADRIVVIKDGEIYEEGTHEELLKNRKLYFNLWENNN